MSEQNQDVDAIPGLQALLAYFEVYRQYRSRLKSDFMPHTERRKPLTGYGTAVDPNAIRVTGPKRSGVERELFKSDPDGRMKRFCKHLDTVLDRFPDYQRELIRRRYLAPLPAKLPSDTTVHDKLRVAGYRGNYKAQKREALELLVEILQLDRM